MAPGSTGDTRANLECPRRQEPLEISLETVRRTRPFDNETCRDDRHCACIPHTFAPGECPESLSAVTSDTARCSCGISTAPPIASSAAVAARPPFPPCGGCLPSLPTPNFRPAPSTRSPCYV